MDYRKKPIAYMLLDGEAYSVSNGQQRDVYVKLLKEKGHEAKRVSKKIALFQGRGIHSTCGLMPIIRKLLPDIEFCHRTEDGFMEYQRKRP